MAKGGHHDSSLYKCQKKVAPDNARCDMRLIVALVDAMSGNAPVESKEDPK
jgi:hypothetical protein